MRIWLCYAACLYGVLSSLASCPSVLAEPHGDAIVFLDLSDGQVREVIDEHGMHCGSPRWSPDGKWIAYDTAPFDDRNREACRVMKIRLDGSQRMELGAGGMPTWAPDGKQIAWHTYHPKSSVVVANQDGNGVEMIIDHWGNPVWLRSGKQIITIDQWQLSAFDLQSGKESSVLRPPEYAKYGYSVSPKGDRVSYRTYDGKLMLGTLGVLSGGIDTRLDTGDVEYSSWSPDGDRLVIAWKSPKAKHYQLYTLTVDSDDPPQRIEGQDSDVPNLQPDWSADGNQIVYRRGVASEAP